MTFSSVVVCIMCGSSSDKLLRTFFLLELPETLFIYSDTFFATSITVETCIGIDLHQYDMTQDMWVVSLLFTNKVGSILLRFFDLKDTFISLTTNFTT